MKKRNRAFSDAENYRRDVYFTRNCTLKKMGYASYDDYLQSELWSSIRLRVLEEGNHKCMSCGEPATQVHHTIYIKPVLDGRSLKGLHAVCAACHYKAEFRYCDHAKLNPKQATAKLKQNRTKLAKQSQFSPLD